jgi:hypothetical protein
MVIPADAGRLVAASKPIASAATPFKSNLTCHSGSKRHRIQANAYAKHI